jgi:integrase
VVEDLKAGVTAAEGYPVADAISDFLDQGMKGKSAETISNYRSLADHPLIPYLGAAKLKKLTADELDRWMDERAAELSNRTLRLVHQILERAIRHAQARDKVRRNVASLILVPEGQEGRPSKAMTLDQAVQVLDQVAPGSEHRLAVYVVVSLLAGVRTEEARALTWAEVAFDEGTVAVYRSVLAKGDTKTRKSRRLLKLPRRAVEALREHRKRQAAERLQAGENGRITIWSSAARTVHHSTGGRSAASSPPSPRPPAWGRSRRHGSYGTRSCPSSVPTASASRTSATWWATAARRSPSPSTARDKARAHHRRHGHEQDPQ